MTSKFIGQGQIFKVKRSQACHNTHTVGVQTVETIDNIYTANYRD